MDYPGKAFVLKSGASVIIGNARILREFRTENDTVRTNFLLNRRIGSDGLKLSPAKGSEEFIIYLKDRFGKKVEIRAGELRLKSVSAQTADCAKAAFVFIPYKKGGIQLDITMVAEVSADDGVIRKHLEISSPQAKKCKIDSIMLEHFVLGPDIKQCWSRPDMKKAYLSEYQTALGQPVYINGMFTGCEFPATDNNIIEKTAFIRYFSGKTLADMCGENSVYTTWPTVFGAARSLDMEVIRADFLEYIRTIAQPLYLRTQYNSWFDHMLEIDDEKIKGSFLEIEKGLTQHGVPPVHSYVVDDGFPDYDKDFWCFNSKFPNELYDSAALAKKLSSEFGLWLGPRGGYNSKTPAFGRRMQRAGKGGYNSRARDVCVADHRYIKNIADFFIDYMDRFDINYWKLDGFLLKPCKSKRHGHPTGGVHGMYCFTDCWENWTDIFEKMRAFRRGQGKNLWINQTSYCNASPWHLQWSESLWMQNSSDVDFIDKTKSGEKLCGKDFDKMLTYRDARYFDFYRTRAYQFPLSNMYNHEPIYGNTAKIHMTEDEFRKYMYMIATRGTAFWELYYSFNLFSQDMWRINADVLRFVRENFHILRNAKLIGDSPDTGAVYGYSAWEGADGIVSVRNPANREQTFSFTLDRLIGVAENASSMQKTTILPYTEAPDSHTYTYGDTIKLKLAPHEILIFRFGVPEKPVALQTAKFADGHTAEFRFDGHVVPGEGSFTLNGKSLDFELQANYTDVRVQIPDVPHTGDAVEIVYALKDIFGRAIAGTESPVFYQDGVIPDAISGNSDFTISLTLSEIPTDGVIMVQNDAYSVLAANGRLVFDCGGVKAKGSADISGKQSVQAHAIRERNGMLKLYINGVLDGSGFDAEKVNPFLKKGEVKCGNCVKALQFTDRALAFDETKQ